MEGAPRLQVLPGAASACSPHDEPTSADALQVCGFFRSLLDSPSSEVAVVARLAARDLCSSVGTNLALLQRETGLDPWVVGPGHLQAALLAKERVEVPDRDKWRVPYLERLLAERLQAYYIADTLAEEQLTVLINSLVVN